MADNNPKIRIIGFTTEYAKKDGQIVARDRVQYVPASSPNMVNSEFVKALIPPEGGFENDDEGNKLGYMTYMWNQIKPAYEAWKSGEALPEKGIPLGAWAGITPQQAAVFKAASIKTVEEIAEMTDTMMGKILLPNVRAMRDMAREFLASRDKSEVAEQLAADRERIRALEEMLVELTAARQAEPVEPDAPAKRKPGRPPKARTEQEEAA